MTGPAARDSGAADQAGAGRNRYGRGVTPPATPTLHLWASIGAPDDPPDRVPAEPCVDCAALVPVELFDRHGRWHRDHQ